MGHEPNIAGAIFILTTMEVQHTNLVARSRTNDIMIRKRLFDGIDFVFGNTIRLKLLQIVSRNTVLKINKTDNQYQN